MTPDTHHAQRLSWWRRRILDPLARQLTQGLSPERLALALAIGGVIAVNPFLGTTTLGCLAAGVLLRLNQPALQIANLLGAPFQLALVVPWVRAGEWLHGAAPLPLSPTLLVEEFAASPVRFLERFGTSGLHAASAWLLAAPLIGAALYFTLRPLLRALGQQLARRRALSDGCVSVSTMQENRRGVACRRPSAKATPGVRETTLGVGERRPYAHPESATRAETNQNAPEPAAARTQGPALKAK